MSFDQAFRLLVAALMLGYGLVGIFQRRIRIFDRGRLWGSQSPPHYVRGRKAVLWGVYMVVLAIAIGTLPYWWPR
jgi:hypothetical protein